MKLFTFTRLMAIVAAAAVLGLGAAGMAAGTGGEHSIKLDLGKMHLDPDQHKLITKPPIPHKPLEIVDLTTGKPVPANTVMKLADGKTTTAGKYFAELNKLEKKFNEMGYTLRDHTGGKVVLHQAIIHENEMAEQAKKLTAAHAEFDAAKMRAIPTHAEIEKSHVEGQKLDPARMKKIASSFASAPAAKPGTFESVKQWNYLLGNKKLAAAYLSGKIEVKGSKDDVHVTGNAKAGGYLINKEINVIRADGLVSAPAQGKGKANLQVTLLGQHIINLDKSTETGTKLNESKSHGIDVHADMEFAIGPIPVSARMGVRGNAGLRYDLAIRPAHATFQLRPFVDASVYAQVSVDLLVASAGAGGEVTLLKDELVFGAGLDLDFDPAKGPILSEHVYAQNEMTMLAGDVYAYARVNYLFGSKEWHHDLFSWKGLHAKGYLFNIHNKSVLIPNFVAAAK